MDSLTEPLSPPHFPGKHSFCTFSFNRWHVFGDRVVGAGWTQGMLEPGESGLGPTDSHSFSSFTSLVL